MIHGVPVEIPGTAQERRGFHFFLTCTVNELSGYFSDDFWDRNVLQLSQSEPTLRHALIAIGTLHERFLTFRSPGEGVEDLVSVFALRQYTKSISHLRKSLATQQPSSEIALMACALFVAFDSLRGHFDSAVAHLRSGLSILRHSPSLYRDILRIFTHLGLQAVLFIDDRSEENHMQFLRGLGDNIAINAEEFSDLNHARYCLTNIIDSMMRFFYVCQFDFQDLAGEPADPLFAGISQQQDMYSDELQKWSILYDAFLLKMSLKISGKELRGAILLKIHQCIATIMIGVNLPPNETDFDEFNPVFEKIVTLSKSLVNAESPGLQSTFSPELGIIGPLYYAALKCRVPHIRREALALLQTPRREGMWDSLVIAKIVERFIMVEEAGRECTTSIDIPEEARVHVVLYSRTPREATDLLEAELPHLFYQEMKGPDMPIVQELRTTDNVDFHKDF
jgi:hypothetical protein